MDQKMFLIALGKKTTVVKVMLQQNLLSSTNECLKRTEEGKSTTIMSFLI